MGIGPDDETPAARQADIERIRKEIGKAESGSGRRAPATGDERLRRLIAERRARLAAVNFRKEHAAREVRRLETEARALADEIAGYEKGLRALLGEVLEHVAGWAEPHWSPVPILGYRMWIRRDGGLRGARTLWDSPYMEARCIDRNGEERDAGGVPHTAGECPRPPCGVYALAGLGGMLASIHLPGRVVGLVSLSGKVVEHERGYRAQFARVVALAANSGDIVAFGSRPQWIEGIFAGGDPAVLPGAAGRADLHPRPVGVIREFFEAERRRYEEGWTSASRNE